jgi:hypothetical protein
VLNDAWPPVNEPITRTLRRTFTIAIVVGLVGALIARAPALALPWMLLALWPSLGGHYVEIAFLNGVRSRLPRARLVQVCARIAWWLAGGVVLGFAAIFTSRVLPLAAPPLRTWWMGAPIFVGVELIAHAGLVLRGRPNFYRGDG